MYRPVSPIIVVLITFSQIRSAHSLLSIIHSMKLLLLLSDEAQIANRRDIELRNAQNDKEESKKKVAALLDELLKPQHQDNPVDQNAMRQ